MSTIIRWNPVREIAAMQNAMDRFFNDSWRNPAWRALEESRIDANPLALDVHETDTAYTVVTSLPGVNADNIQIKLHEDILTVEGEIQQPTVQQENTRTLLQERVYGKYSRRIRLPQPVDAGKVEAAYENGVLTLTLPKAEEAQPRMIPVKTHGNGKHN